MQAVRSLPNDDSAKLSNAGTHNSAALLRNGTARLAAAGIEQPRLDAGLLLEHATAMPRGAFFLDDRDVSPDQACIFDRLIARREAREPLAKIVGRKEFWSLSFEVDSSTLDPRPDSETLIELLLERRPDRSAALRLLDLGTGSGCLLLAALSEYPKASGIGIERSAEALAVARSNAASLGLADRAEMLPGDWSDAAPKGERFDIILCNPPYIAEGERDSLMPEVALHDPATALFAGSEGLDDYRAILPQVASHLAPGGVAIFEIGAGQHAAVTALAEAAGLLLLTSKKDLGGVIRALAFQPHSHSTAKDSHA